MKTTVDLPDDLLRRARERARDEKTTLRALLTEALRRVVEHPRPATSRFRLRQASFAGNGLRPGVREGSWSRIRDLGYEGGGS